MRRLVAENELSINDLVYPLFTCPGTNVKEPIASMDGCFHLSPDLIVEERQWIPDQRAPANHVGVTLDGGGAETVS